MQPFQANRHYLQTRVSETLGLLYADHFPYRNLPQRAVSGDHRFTIIWQQKELVLARWPAGSGLIGFLPQEARDAGKIAAYDYTGVGKTGLILLQLNIARSGRRLVLTCPVWQDPGQRARCRGCVTTYCGE